LRPSDIFHCETELAAWQLDEACLITGRRVENNIQQNKLPFDGLDIPATTTPNGYRSTSHIAAKKVQIKEDGTW
jgi:hypothetical protein